MIQAVTIFTPAAVALSRRARVNPSWHSHRKGNAMKLKMNLVAIALGSLSAGAAFTQAGTVQRDVNQQQRVEQGLQSGSLSTGEAARLEREQSRIERDQARALKDGN